MYVSQAFAEIKHFRKCRGNSGNAEAIEGILELPRQLRKTQAFLEMPRQLRKFVIDNAQILGNGTVSVKNYFKTKLGYPILTLP